MPHDRSRPASRSTAFWEAFTRDFDREDLQRLFTRDAPDALRFFSRGIDLESLTELKWHQRLLIRARVLLLAFSLKLTPARRVLFGASLVLALLGLLELFRGFSVIDWPVFIGVGLVKFRLPVPVWASGTVLLLIGFLLMNLLVLLEVADRLSLKNDLEIARDIQQAMLPHAAFNTSDLQAFGLTRPANTVGGDFYDILPLEDGRIVVAIGDVAGKGSPAALLMALLLAIFRTLVDERLEPAALAARLNLQVAHHSPASRFITLFFGIYDPATGRLEYVNAGQTPPLVWRKAAVTEPLLGGGMALGMFEHAEYLSHEAVLGPDDLLVMYSDGVTEAENRAGGMFEEAGLRSALGRHARGSAQEVASGLLREVEAFASDAHLADDLTLLVLRRLDPAGAGPGGPLSLPPPPDPPTLLARS